MQTMPLEKECTPLPEVRVLHSFIIVRPGVNFYWRIFVVAGLGYVFFSHISWVAQEFGFTRSGLTWESDKEEQRKNIMDENNRKRKAEEEKLSDK